MKFQGTPISQGGSWAPIFAIPEPEFHSLSLFQSHRMSSTLSLVADWARLWSGGSFHAAEPRKLRQGMGNGAGGGVPRPRQPPVAFGKTNWQKWGTWAAPWGNGIVLDIPIGCGMLIQGGGI